MDNTTKFVEFWKYCSKCKHYRKKDFEEPCNSCLEVGTREETEVPERFEEGKK